ncbi:MAG: VWA domain-containing protein [Halorhodospira halophila]|uniref:nitric oxide reductase activation protein NorD n=1 Tax=Halorhodospira TaxID=85108 RepID=UPI001EE8EE06|nr:MULTISPECIES: VWA domain-containing protein [Halorhodospira]MCC3751169.1 VWA domain-containing protein [Halorhodospira halophila]MCG5532428.1 VWA domain-containing protein [Halorhodospira sp. 9621]
MTVRLEDYRETLVAADPRIAETLEASFAEASRVMSPRGLHNYLEGARALAELGRGADLVICYLEAMPAVAKEVGEDVLTEVVTAAMKLSSMVSGQVIALLLAGLPTAARRLGDPELLRQFLNLVHQLSAKAPRGLRPMLENLDELFSKLTLGGFRRWALWGAQAHARDFEQQRAYFGLQSADSQAMLQQERRGTLLVDNQRKLNFYLRALWARDFFMRPTSGDFETREGYKPFIEQRVIHLPDAYDDYHGLPGKDLYRAAAAHAAAHLVHTIEPLSPEMLNPAQMAVIGLIEDARVEALAIDEFPGLQRLWLPFHRARAAEREAELDPVVERLERAAHALLDPEYADDDPWVQQVREIFHYHFADRPRDVGLSWELGMELHNSLAQRYPMPSARVLQRMAVPYRDDNRYLFASDEEEWLEAEYIPASHRQVRRQVNLMEFVNEVDCELAGDDAQEVWVLGTELFPYEDFGVSYNEMEGVEPASPPFHYPEWDYQVQLNRPDWVTVVERRPKRGDPEVMDQVLKDYRPVASRLRYLVDALQPQGVIRERRQEDGDELDIDAAVRSMVDLRLGMSPDPRINTRYIRKTRDLSALLLLDLSESTNDAMGGSEKTVIELTREATSLLGWAINGIGDPFAVHGFSSDGRHDVQYYRFKDFHQPWSEEAKSRLAGMRGQYSTRMGAAMRHAGAHLVRQPQRRKLLLIVTDGEPHDVDVRDPQYLRHDARKAAEELSARGVTSYCLTLDRDADAYVSRIFGANGYSVVEHVERLPERLPAVFAQLTR